MAELIASARRAFLQSPHHAVMALLTLGAGFATGEPLYFVAGLTAYVLGWVYLPDMAFFQRWRDRRVNAETSAAEASELAQFAKRRDALLAALPAPLRERYHLLAKVCRDIEQAAAESEEGTEFNLSSDTRLRKIDELMWMYLRLLTMQQSLEAFLETERHEDLSHVVSASETELREVETEMKALQDRAQIDAKLRLLGSKRERLEVLRKRLQRVNEGASNLELVLSEEERLSEQIKLIRADALATKNADALSARINASVAHLNETNKWLSEMDQFRDLTGDLPLAAARIGFATTGVPPPLPDDKVETAQPNSRAREQQ